MKSPDPWAANRRCCFFSFLFFFLVVGTLMFDLVGFDELYFDLRVG